MLFWGPSPNPIVLCCPLEADVDRVGSGCLVDLPGELNTQVDNGQTKYIKIEL